ncbi:TPA: hypothetical protein HA239_04440 [Candidatus Woesearchaeota archaeon]|nr:hypothetical protein QT06_C0001G0574 [archaeon GW2011_AR15]MBS3103885.1 hypothetical protein [Candidatus Woesearchaeota archaeon]HIH41638.1 hypothetical protein [Candidatus Woesearchaeota archaeon]
MGFFDNLKKRDSSPGKTPEKEEFNELPPAPPGLKKIEAEKPVEMPEYYADTEEEKNVFTDSPVQEDVAESNAEIIKDDRPKISVPDSLPDIDIPVPPDIEEIPFFRNAAVAKPAAELPEFAVKEIKKGPVFVRTDEYSGMLSGIDSMEGVMKEGQETVYLLKNLKKNADTVHEKYLNTLEDIQKKLMYVDHLLFESMK